MKSFVHLHLHSEYSLLDGTIQFKPLIERVKKLKMPAVAVTDHGGMMGTIAFYEEA
ncbi:MAG: PHP domain-containing protein, partial [Deltaproteobacteria bacterium]